MVDRSRPRAFWRCVLCVTVVVLMGGGATACGRVRADVASQAAPPAVTVSPVMRAKVDHTPTIRVGERDYDKTSEAGTSVTEDDVLRPLGPFTVPYGNVPEALEPRIAYEVRGLDPTRYVAFRTQPSTATTVLDGRPREFKTTGWALAIAVGVRAGDELCPYIRAEFKKANNCPS